MAVRAERALPGGAERVYWLYAGAFSLLFWLTATLNVLYMATDVGLAPLQMVVVGSVLEASVFLFEVPTGMVADLVSRRLSVLVGLALIGAGFLVQGLGRTFAAMLLAQVVWGIGYTFTSGADTAWLADELAGADEDGARLASVLTRATQLRLAGALAGIGAAAALGLVDIQLPLVASGAGFVVLAAVLAPLMRETAFRPAPREGRSPLGQMRRSLSEGLAIARRRRVVRALMIAALLTGMAGEAVDRLWTVRVVADVDPPLPGGASLSQDQARVMLFAAIALAGTLLALAVSLAANRLAGERLSALHPHRLLAGLVLVEAAAIVALALGGALWIVLAALWTRTAVQALAQPIEAAWLNRQLDPATRATSLSLNGQADAVGQVLGGPPLGALGSRAGVPAALLASAAVLAPAALVLARLRPARV